MTLKHYKDIFFHGYVIAFTSILAIAFLFDLYIENYADAQIEIVTLLFVGGLYYLWIKSAKKNTFCHHLGMAKCLVWYLNHFAV